MLVTNIIILCFLIKIIKITHITKLNYYGPFKYFKIVNHSCANVYLYIYY